MTVCGEAHYIVFHPDRQRQSVQVSAKVLDKRGVCSEWSGLIYVDKINEGNEDPYVFNDRWLYSYCHATQLRQVPQSGPFVKPGSVILFVSGDDANNAMISADTVFVCGSKYKWSRIPKLRLPEKFHLVHGDSRSALWRRHFRFPFAGIHKSVRYTHEAKMYKASKTLFSYLPVSVTGEKVKFPFQKLPQTLRLKVERKVKGKYPVMISAEEMEFVLGLLDKYTEFKVVADIELTN